MIFELRYHIFTITAIFAALGLGILIGTSIIGNEGLVKEQNKIISNIGENIKKLKEENNELEQSIANLEEKLKNKKIMENELLSFLLQDKFSGNKYVLVASEMVDLKGAEEIISNAGASLIIRDKTTNIKEIKEGQQIIYWNIKADNISKNLKQKALFCSKPDLINLIITLLENNKDECISNNSGI